MGTKGTIKLSFFSKIIIVFYIIVIVGSLSLVSIFEVINRKQLKDIDAMKIIFNTLSARSAGFSTVDVNTYFSPTSKYLLSILMWIGCAPLSTGGGIKITTFAIIILAVFGRSDNRNNLRFFKRNIAADDVAFVYKVGFFSFLLIAIGIMIVLASTEGDINFLDAVFYSNSTMGNVGLTTFKIVKNE